MSIKLYTGFRMPKNTSVFALQRKIEAFRVAERAHMTTLRATEIACELALRVDKNASGIEADAQPWFTVWNKRVAERQERTLESDDSISFHPYRDRIYGITFLARNGHARWLASSNAEDWPYWNNTDRPHNLTARQWRDRERTWGKVLNDWASPASCGLVAQIWPAWEPHISVDVVLQHMPNHESRARALAKEVLINERVAQRPEGSSPGLTAMDAVVWLRTPEGEAQLAAKSAELGPKLPVVITRTHIGY